MSTAVDAPERSIAIISPVKDFLFFFASAAVVLLAWAATSLGVAGWTILTVVAVVSNGPHLVSTWTRVYFDPKEWRARKLSALAVPPFTFALIFLLTWKLATDVTIFGHTFQFLGPRLINSVILYWATWHFVAQNWGILRIYQRKSGEPIDSTAVRLERPLLLLIVLFCLTHRLYTGPRQLFGLEVLHPPLQREWVLSLLAPIAVLLGVILVTRVRERTAPWSKAGWVRLAFIGASFLGFFVPFQLITTDDTSAFAAAACWHGFQYLGMVRHYNRNAWRRGVDARAPLISWLSQPGWTRAFLYWVLLMALAGTVYVLAATLTLFTSGTFPVGQVSSFRVLSFLPQWDFFGWAGVIWVSATLSHYWIDGVIWKLRRPELAQRVGLDDPAALAAS
jgi:hypothetical protein